MIGENSEIQSPYIEFDEPSHTYTYKGRRLTSISKVVESYAPPFPRDIIIKKYAKKHGLTEKEVSDDWQQKNSDSIVLGNYIHKIAEDIFTSESMEYTVEYDENIIKKAWVDNYVDFLLAEKKKIISEGWRIYSEVILVIPRYGIAGTSDLVLVNWNENKCKVMDWKTNRMKAKGKRFDLGKNRLYYPFDKLYDSKKTKYTLQISGYAYMLRSMHRFDMEDSSIVHFDDDEINVYNIPYDNYFGRAVIANYKEEG